ncbi:hypothetical protein BGLA2_40014 [Burkholderia gladioli]|nr:hypothetical protein BGLA2_40014 [Burkholderia gladioli]
MISFFIHSESDRRSQKAMIERGDYSFFIYCEADHELGD